MTKNSVFAFYSHFHELLPTVLGVSGRFAWLERPDTCLRVMTKKLVVFAFYGRFNELFPTVLGVSWRFAWLERPDTCLRVMTKNSSFSLFMVVFMSYCPQFSEFRGHLRGLRDPIHV